MIERGRADLIITTSLLMDKVLDSKKFTTFNDQKLSSKIYHFISKDKVHLSEKLKKEILKSKNNGAFDISKLKYKK